ncbi:hypothetical protein ACVXHA_25545 [Escherichia coli]
MLSGEAQCCGALSLVALVAGRGKPRTLRGKTSDNRTGANLNHQQFKHSCKMLSLQQGGYMTLA